MEKGFIVLENPEKCVRCPLKSQLYDEQYICTVNHRHFVSRHRTNLIGAQYVQCLKEKSLRALADIVWIFLVTKAIEVGTNA